MHETHPRKTGGVKEIKAEEEAFFSYRKKASRGGDTLHHFLSPKRPPGEKGDGGGEANDPFTPGPSSHNRYTATPASSVLPSKVQEEQEVEKGTEGTLQERGGRDGCGQSTPGKREEREITFFGVCEKGFTSFLSLYC